MDVSHLKFQGYYGNSQDYELSVRIVLNQVYKSNILSTDRYFQHLFSLIEKINTNKTVF